MSLKIAAGALGIEPQAAQPRQCQARNRLSICDGSLGASKEMVGVRGFEPPAPASRKQCSTRLSYTPAAAPYSAPTSRAATNCPQPEKSMERRCLGRRRNPAALGPRVGLCRRRAGLALGSKTPFRCKNRQSRRGFASRFRRGMGQGPPAPWPRIPSQKPACRRSRRTCP
jgi:hypothetical protein